MFVVVVCLFLWSWGFFVCSFGVWLLFLFPHGLKHLNVFLGEVSSGSEIYNEAILPPVKHE